LAAEGRRWFHWIKGAKDGGSLRCKGQAKKDANNSMFHNYHIYCALIRSKKASKKSFVLEQNHRSSHRPVNAGDRLRRDDVGV
jgi:hypothetical protein